jgi:hypothetical protein
MRAGLFLERKGYKMSDIVEYKSNNFYHFKQIVNSMASLLKDYCKHRYWEDCPYFYTERSNVGLFSSAAIKTNDWISIEEFTVTRRRVGTGRCDLYMKNIRNKDHPGYIIETKKTETKSVDRISRMLESACRDVGKISTGDAGDSVRVGIVFVVPPTKNDPEDNLINDLIKKFDSVACDFSSHIYLDCFRDQTGFGRYSGTYYPGISIFGKNIRI